MDREIKHKELFDRLSTITDVRWCGQWNDDDDIPMFSQCKHFVVRTPVEQNRARYEILDCVIRRDSTTYRTDMMGTTRCDTIDEVMDHIKKVIDG